MTLLAVGQATHSPNCLPDSAVGTTWKMISAEYISKRKGNVCLIAAVLSTAAFGVVLAYISTAMLHLSKWFLAPFVYATTTASSPKSSPNGTAARQCVFPSLIEATTAELQEGLTKGCFSSVDLVNAYVTRINEVNSTLHMVLEVNPDAWDIARQLDLERKYGRVRGPLHGLPILVKGNIGTEDKTETAGKLVCGDTPTQN